MADNFVSYARDDQARIQSLVRALEAEGFSVFWDPDILPGDVWDEVLERELTNARAVIVAWTETSRASRWVREEAHFAFEHRKLIPLTLDPSGPPFGFRTIQAADFIGWDGDKSAACWQRLKIMLEGVMQAAERDAARADPTATAPSTKQGEPPSDPEPTDAARAKPDAPVQGKAVTSGTASHRASNGRHRFSFRDLALGVAAMAALLVASAAGQGILGGAIMFAAAIFILFQSADSQMAPAYHALARRWLIPVKDGLRINVAEAFQTMFLAVFWHRHFSFRCLWRSALASTLAFAALMGFAWLFIEPFQAAFRAEWGPFLRNLMITFLVANIAADYFSLFQTRLFILFLTRHPRSAPIVVIVDFIATLVILAIVLYGVNALSQWASFALGQGAAGEADALAERAGVPRSFQWPGFVGFYEGLIPQLTNPQAGIADLTARSWLLILAACTTYITSVWLLFILVFGTLLRVLVGRDGKPTWLGGVLAARERPFTAFGAVSAALVLGLAVPVHAVADAVIRMTPSPVMDPVLEPNGIGVASRELAQDTPASVRVPVSSEAPASLTDFSLFRECDACPEMVVLPAGSFTMGSPPDEAGRFDDEGPQRRVTIAEPFAVGRFEVTFAEWQACVEDGGCASERAPYDQGWGRGRRPVINVSWDHAQEYLVWLNSRVGGEPYRLLTEAEWEYAARAGTTTPWSTGEMITSAQANFYGDTFLEQTVPVGGYASNPFGLYDMHGNVWEWTQDCWNMNYEGAPGDGTARTDGDCSRRVVRGGSWDINPQFLRSAYRGRYVTTDRSNYVGFRVARTL